MEYVTIIVMLALVEYLAFGVAVGTQRARSGVKAPAVTGDATFERYFRAHQNTLEQLVVFVPGAYAAAYWVSPLYAVVAGLAYLVGRAMYFRAYTRDAEKRGPGTIVTMLANLALVLAGIAGALISLI